MENLKSNFSPRSGFLDLISYFSKNPKYKDGFGDAGIIKFITQYSLGDTVIGNANIWLEAIDFARLAKQADVEPKEFSQSIGLILRKIPNKGVDIEKLYFEYNNIDINFLSKPRGNKETEKEGSKINV